jgi:Putative auto-transporter adhesin, head GIN domain
MRPLLLAALALALLAGCGGGPQMTQTRDVGPFTRLDVSSDIDVDVVPGDSSEVKVIGGEKVIDRVVTTASDGVLHVQIRDRGIVIGPDPFDDISVQISADALDGIRVEGSSHLKLGNIDRDELSIEVMGSGDVEASGNVGNLIATIEGSGDAHLFDLEAKSATVSVEGAGDAELNVTDKLDITVQGAGDIRYRGNPSIRQTVEGAGDIRPAD